MPENKEVDLQKKKDDVNTKDVMRLKRAWERLKARQAHIPLRKARIYSVNIVDDGKGGRTLQVLMSNGGKFSDDGDKKNLFHAMERRRKHSFSRLMSLVGLARVVGVDTVASNLPPGVRRAFMRAYARHGSNTATVQKQEDGKETLHQQLQKRQHFKDSIIVQNLMNRNGGR